MGTDGSQGPKRTQSLTSLAKQLGDSGSGGSNCAKRAQRNAAVAQAVGSVTAGKSVGLSQANRHPAFTASAPLSSRGATPVKVQQMLQQLGSEAMDGAPAQSIKTPKLNYRMNEAVAEAPDSPDRLPLSQMPFGEDGGIVKL